MNAKAFLKQCIAEVLVEPTKPSPLRHNKKMASFIRQCIAEVIVEPAPRKTKVYGNPRRLQAAHLIKECIMEVLKENLLSEAFDPTSQGPNIPQENPYPEMNAKMARLEEEQPKPKDDAWKRYEQGYSAGEAHKRSGQKPKDTLDNVASIGYHDALKGKAKASPDVVRKTVREGDPHGRYAQQAGATPFQSPGDTSIVEDQDPEAVITKVRKEVYAALASEGLQPHGDEPRDYVEYYLNGFVTVQVSVGYDSKAARVERYYDNEMVNNMPGHNVVRSFPVPVPYSPSFVQKFIKYAIALKRAGEGDESLFGGFDDIEEGQRTQSTSVQWNCPHCGELTDIDVEIESPSDYIACADCEHCGKEISDPKLDQQVYQAVINHYSGKADYLKDTH
jgi:transcription elongation factor Elf1